MERRSFLRSVAATSLSMYVGGSFTGTGVVSAAGKSKGAYTPARIVNEYYHLLPGEREALAKTPAVATIQGRTVTLAGGRKLELGDVADGWRVAAVADYNGVPTAVLEKHVTHRGAIAYVTVDRGVIAMIPTFVGDIAKIRPREVAAPSEVQLKRPAGYKPGPDVSGKYVLGSNEDPCYENVAALGPEFIGWTLVGNEHGGPEHSLFLQPDGTSRELNNNPAQASWAPDELAPVIDPRDYFPSDNVHLWKYENGYSKRTILGGYTPTAHTGVWNDEYKCGYELMVVLSEEEDARPITRMRMMVPEDQISPGMHVSRDANGRAFVERYTNGDANRFFFTLAGIWNKWSDYFESTMPVNIPDEALRDAARAGIMLSRCSYRGLEPTYQIGEGAYTKIPERSHALFPVAQYEFIWALQLWNMTPASDDYFQFYLDKYVLPDGNLQYNVQDQAEAPLNVGFFLRNSARGYLYRRDLDVFKRRLPALRKMTDYVLQRYEFSKRKFNPSDPHYGLMWGSPEADLGDPQNEFPDSHPYYYQNAVGVWRGLQDHALALKSAAVEDPTLSAESSKYEALAAEMRGNIQTSLAKTLAARNPAMTAAAITPFSPEDTTRKPTELLSYENHRFMQDWLLADWGDPTLDEGHLKHRTVAGMELVGLHIDGVEQRTSNFMEHGTLAAKIRSDDYRSFLLTLYGLLCFTADSGNHYSPEDALIPGGYAGEGNRYWWSAVINSVLQPTVGLRWLLCYEESDQDVCHLQKAAPKHWFRAGERIEVQRCPTRFGEIGWKTDSLQGRRWTVTLTVPESFNCTVKIHLHPDDDGAISKTSHGQVLDNIIVLSPDDLKGKRLLEIAVQ
jgi:hypothetical protein